MKTLNQYIKLAGETSGTTNSQESKNASNAIGRAIKKAFPNCKVTHSVGHFYCTGFVRNGEKVVYYSFSDYRFFGDSGIIRYARDEKDYTGQENISVNSGNIVSKIGGLL